MLALSLSQAKLHLSQAIAEAERQHQPVFISSHGKVKAVLLSIHDYQQTQNQMCFAERLQVWRDSYAQDMLIDDDIFTQTRISQSQT
ncbi:MAG: type II toxin-antitoxin system Phd/YefM family antitoxin [Moraxellaceae bacterium]|nr:type II toxin-antitoxin system Phd/YefM family antitoxin [Pseudomonadales bacterium]MCP5175020.1 type II toxin-antitoxin system Phd/YefM family antitoxin [Moraxellaceae bacterium]HQV22497.1 type II toxin-antitoxin system Phd/YefM family antitoxin [Agitococcus sp.]